MTNYTTFKCLLKQILSLSNEKKIEIPKDKLLSKPIFCFPAREKIAHHLKLINELTYQLKFEDRKLKNRSAYLIHEDSKQIFNKVINQKTRVNKKSIKFLTPLESKGLWLKKRSVLRDLPSPYIPHPCGLLHLPRFIAKIRKHLKNELPPSYQRNFTKGFDGFLCLHLGIEPQVIIDLVQKFTDNPSLDQELLKIFPKDLKIHIWNRKLVQMGMSEMGRETLNSTKEKMNLSHRNDLLSFADMIEIDEGRIN